MTLRTFLTPLHDMQAFTWLVGHYYNRCFWLFPVVLCCRNERLSFARHGQVTVFSFFSLCGIFCVVLYLPFSVFIASTPSTLLLLLCYSCTSCILVHSPHLCHVLPSSPTSKTYIFSSTGDETILPTALFLYSGNT